MMETSVPGLLLRPIEATDGLEIWRILSEPGVGEQICPNWDLASSANFGPMIGWGAPNSIAWTVFWEQRVVGVFVLGELDWRNRTARVFCHALSRELKGRHFGSAIHEAMRSWCWDQGFCRVWTTAFFDLQKSRARVESYGGFYEGTDRSALLHRGKRIDQHRFAWLKGE